MVSISTELKNFIFNICYHYNWNQSEIIDIIENDNESKYRVDTKTDTKNYNINNCFGIVIKNGKQTQCSRKKKFNNLCGLHNNKLIKHGSIKKIDSVVKKKIVKNKPTNKNINYNNSSTGDIINSFENIDYINNQFKKNNRYTSLNIQNTKYLIDIISKKIFIKDLDEYVYVGPMLV